MLRHFCHWNISVICLTVVLNLAITVFFSLYFQTFWPKWLNFFRSFQKRFGLWPKKNSFLHASTVTRVDCCERKHTRTASKALTADWVIKTMPHTNCTYSVRLRSVRDVLRSKAVRQNSRVESDQRHNQTAQDQCPRCCHATSQTVQLKNMFLYQRSKKQSIMVFTFIALIQHNMVFHYLATVSKCTQDKAAVQAFTKHKQSPVHVLWPRRTIGPCAASRKLSWERNKRPQDQKQQSPEEKPVNATTKLSTFMNTLLPVRQPFLTTLPCDKVEGVSWAGFQRQFDSQYNRFSYLEKTPTCLR